MIGTEIACYTNGLEKNRCQIAQMNKQEETQYQNKEYKKGDPFGTHRVIQPGRRTSAAG